jgi:hypothetical protein
MKGKNSCWLLSMIRWLFRALRFGCSLSLVFPLFLLLCLHILPPVVGIVAKDAVAGGGVGDEEVVDGEEGGITAHKEHRAAVAPETAVVLDGPSLGETGEKHHGIEGEGEGEGEGYLRGGAPDNEEEYLGERIGKEVLQDDQWGDLSQDALGRQ